MQTSIPVNGIQTRKHAIGRSNLWRWIRLGLWNRSESAFERNINIKVLVFYLCIYIKSKTKCIPHFRISMKYCNRSILNNRFSCSMTTSMTLCVMNVLICVMNVMNVMLRAVKQQRHFRSQMLDSHTSASWSWQKRVQSSSAALHDGGRVRFRVGLCFHVARRSGQPVGRGGAAVLSSSVSPSSPPFRRFFFVSWPPEAGLTH